MSSHQVANNTQPVKVLLGYMDINAIWLVKYYIYIHIYTLGCFTKLKEAIHCEVQDP